MITENEMYEIQRNLQKRISPEVNNAINSSEEKVKEDVSIMQAVYMSDECFEVLRELNFKPWRSIKDINREKLLEELVDVRKFLMNLELIWGFSIDDIHNKFLEKTQINIDRSNGK
ncbi:MAG: dUTP diphosphatase [Acidithiobacillus sp.]|jgi:dimeric dUTPase (all-alpha-NTP-PPase superfamily)|uniref:dUTP diphosphatase n=1 Tax=Acidithiobacillus sp. TaxID=1872118 RepID=UPI00355CA516